jgi:hypothetical protein
MTAEQGRVYQEIGGAHPLLCAGHSLSGSEILKLQTEGNGNALGIDVLKIRMKPSHFLQWWSQGVRCCRN